MHARMHCMELSAGLQVFDELLAKHCAAGPFASRDRAAARARVVALHRMLSSARELLAAVLCPSADAPPNGAAGAEAVIVFAKSARKEAVPSSEAEEAGSLTAAATRFWRGEPGLTRDIFSRLLRKCKVAGLRGRRLASVLETSEAAARQAHAAASAQEAEAASASSHFFGLVSEAIGLGRKFSMMRLLELQQSATRRWS